MSVPEDEIRAATLHLVSAYQTLIGQQNWDAWIELWAEDCELIFPFAPVGRTRIYRGKAEIKAYMSATPGRVAIDGIDHARVFSMQDPTMAVAEVSVRGHIPATGAPYNQSYVLFFETKDGKLWRYREYWNPLVFIDALGGHEAGNAGGAV
jgi:ketosteroid isomerase-like protein